MKGVICAGGHGTRLQPATCAMNKHMIPILERPMILYPLDTMKALGITDIMIVTGGGNIGAFAEFLGSGREYGVNLTYRVQEDALGIAHAVLLAKDFVGSDSVAVVLGDNIFETSYFSQSARANIEKGKAFFFFREVEDPERFGVPVFENGKVVVIEEKPAAPKSRFAVTGLYIYPPNVFDIISTLSLSSRGEMEISDVNNWYIAKRKFCYAIFPGFWRDAGTRDSLKEVIDWAYKSKR